MLLAVTAALAQSYTVYSVIGTASIVDGKGTTPLKPRKLVTAKTRLHISPESAVTLLDEKNGKMYSFSSEGTSSVGGLIAKMQNRGKSLSKQYMSYLVKQLFANGSSQMSHPDTYMQVTATSYRSASSDSMLLARLTQMLPGDGGLSAEEYLCSPDNPVETDMKVSFELVSCDTGFPMSTDVQGSTGSYVRVHNDTEEPLYVNVLDIDDKGNKYLVLPVDSAATCAHLLVPPMCTVSFKSEPFIFADDQSKETFLLVATQEPVDFSILMSPIQKGSRKAMKSGVYRQFYYVKE